MSTQSPRDQKEFTEREHLPFPLLSDQRLEFARALDLPTFESGAATLLKRLTLVVEGVRIIHVFYPAFPSDRHAEEVIAWLSKGAT